MSIEAELTQLRAANAQLERERDAEHQKWREASEVEAYLKARLESAEGLLRIFISANGLPLNEYRARLCNLDLLAREYFSKRPI